jgi:hypothetical protein
MISCDLNCQVEIVNGPWSDWRAITECSPNSRTLVEQRFFVRYDANRCGVVDNSTIYHNRTVACDPNVERIIYVSRNSNNDNNILTTSPGAAQDRRTFDLLDNEQEGTLILNGNSEPSRRNQSLQYLAWVIIIAAIIGILALIVLIFKQLLY